MKRYKPHPVALLFPAMLPEEYEFLKEDIRQHGLKHPIVLLAGKIIDGWHRYQICLELRIQPRFVEMRKNQDALAESISQNLARRQLSPAQRYGVFLRIAEEFPEIAEKIQAVKDQAKQRQVNGTPLPHQRQRSSQLIGQMVGVSHATVERVDRLRRLSPEGFEEVVEGKAPLLHTLYQVSASARWEKHDALNSTNGVVPEVRLICGDFRKVLKAIPPITLCWADLPWDRGSLHLWDDVGRVAAKALRPGGVLLAYPSKVELPQVMNFLGKHLRFHWTCAAIHTEHRPLPQLKVLTKWQPILMYYKGQFDPPVHFLDVTHMSSKEKDRHPWQRPVEEFAYYTGQLTRQGEWILDLTAGSFGSGKAAKNLGRNYIGVDIDAKAVARGRKWITEG